MTPAELLEAAKAIIDTPEKWIRGLFKVKDCYCSIGALMQAKNQNSNGDTALHSPIITAFHSPIMSAYTMAHVYLDTAVRSHPKNRSNKPIISFNDDPQVEHKDVMEAFDTAILLAKEKQEADMARHGLTIHGEYLTTSTQADEPSAQVAHQETQSDSDFPIQ